MIELFGGRKNILGYAFLGCVTFIVYVAIQNADKPDFLGLATVIGAMAAGVGTLVWGNVKEWESKSKPDNQIK